MVLVGAGGWDRAAPRSKPGMEKLDLRTRDPTTIPRRGVPLPPASQEPVSGHACGMVGHGFLLGLCDRPSVFTLPFPHLPLR